VTDPVQDDQAQGDSASVRAAESPPQTELGDGGVGATGATYQAGGGATYQAGAAA
jgi:hypothetical protein